MLEINNLSFSYKPKANVIQELNLSAKGGQVVGLLGQNGAGKTTLINLIAGLIKPDQGQCHICGQDVRKRHPATLADIFYLPEVINSHHDTLQLSAANYNNHPFTNQLTAKRYRRAHAPFYPRFDEDAFQRYCNQFGIDEKQTITAFSMGERKLFFLAFGLATGARLLLLDEPTNGLDVLAKGHFRQFIAEAVAEQEKMAIISTHQMRELDSLMDPIAILQEGSIRFHLTMDQIVDKLTVDIVAEAPPDAIYTQPTTGGIAVLRARREDEAARRIDLELLFNAAITDPDRLSETLE